MTEQGRSIFITATDTGAGKTAVTAFLLHRLLAKGMDACALKPVASGLDENGANADITALMSAGGSTDMDRINRYRFAMPASPNLAAEAEGKRIDPERLVAWCQSRCQEHQICLIEGIGGLMVPLTTHFLVRDWMNSLPQAEIMLVVAARLGAINHTLLTLAELKRMGRTPRWIVINDADGGQQQMATQISRVLFVHLAPGTSVLMLPYMNDEMRNYSEMSNTDGSWLADWVHLVEEYSV